MSRLRQHGCSTLWYSEQREEVSDAGECCAVSILSHGAGLADHEDIETEAAHACKYAWIGSDPRQVFTQGDIPGVMRGIFYFPVRADSLGGASGSDRAVRDVEGGFVCLVKQPG